MEIKRATLSKEERLKSTKAIASLFREGNAFLVYPMKIVWKAETGPASFPVQAAFSVSGRVFRKSVTRNLLKRRMREAFRLTKNEFFTSPAELKILVMFIYIAKEETDFARIKKSMASGLSKISRKTTPFSHT